MRKSNFIKYECNKCHSVIKVNEDSKITKCSVCGFHSLEQIGLEMIKEQKDECLELLKKENLIELFDKEFDKKIVKEHEARKTIFLILNMRNVENLGKGTDNLIINAVSGTGKDYITESIFEILPNEEKEELVKTTPKVLSYTRNRKVDPKATWRKMALRLEDVSNNVVNDDSFKVFLSANPNKVNYGKTVNRGQVIEIEIEGKPTIILTIANATVGDEQLRRLPNIFLDEGIKQTKEILQRQAKFAIEGKSLDYNQRYTNALRLLKKVNVKIPYAEKLVQIFENSTENVIIRTAFPRFLDYIKASASLYQYQRKKDSKGSILANEQDYMLGAMCLEKTTSNVYMIPLNRLDEAIYSLFKERRLQNISLEELFDLEEIQKLGRGERWIRFRLDFLVSKKFLTRKSEKVENSFKPVNKYSFQELKPLEIPKFSELTNYTSNTTNTANTTINTYTSNTQVNEANEVNATFLTNGS